MQNDSGALYAGQLVIVHGLRGPAAHDNRLFARVQNYDPLLNRFRVKLSDDRVLTLDTGNLFVLSMHMQYFATPYADRELLTACTRVVTNGTRKCLVATQRIPAGSVLGCPSFRISLTAAQIRGIEAEFEAWVTANIPTLMGTPAAPFIFKLDTQYDPVLPFVGALAEPGVWHHPMLITLNVYDPTEPPRLLELWTRTNAVHLVWFAFWRSKLAHLAPKHVWHAWHFALTFAWPSGDRRSVVVSQTICSMPNPPERLREYQKVADGLQDAAVDNLVRRCHSSVIPTPIESADRMQVFFIDTVEVGQPVYLDAGAKETSNPCDTVLNCLFMDDFNGFQWLSLYKNILRCLGQPPVIARSLQTFINDNVYRVQAMTSEPTPSARTTPNVHMLPPAQPLPRCARCAQPLHSKFVCARCKNAAYCSKTCQTAAWTTHKRECRPPAAPE